MQIQTSKQHAASLVHFYPYIPYSVNFIEAIARQHEAPSIEALTQPGGGTDYLQHAANWQTVLDYTATFHADNIHDHHRLVKDK